MKRSIQQIAEPSRPARRPLVVTTAALLTLALPAASLLCAAAPPARQRAHAAPRHSATPAASAADAGFNRAVRPLIQKYCVSCHAGKNAPAGIDLASAKDASAVLKNRSAWDRVAQNVGNSHMPPAGSPAPTKAERDGLVEWVQSTTSAADCKLNDPGHVTLRRLNRAEYNNTVRDLCGVDIHPGDEFPNDDVGYGFDNIGDVLSISPLLMEKYIAAAAKVAHAAFQNPDDVLQPVQLNPPSFSYLAQATRVGDHAALAAQNAEVDCDYLFPTAGDYVLRAVVYQSQAGPEAAKMQFKLDDKDILSKNVFNAARTPMNAEVRMPVPGGKHKLSVVFTNPFHDNTDYSNLPRQQQRNRNLDRRLNVKQIVVLGPLHGPNAQSPLMQQLGNPQPDAAAAEPESRKFLAEFAGRAYRRPATHEEVEKLVHCADLARSKGESFQQSIEYAITAALCSPNFLFRIETRPAVAPAPAKSAAKPAVRLASRRGVKAKAKTVAAPATSAKYQLSDYALASRLSYFLWSSMPDDELLGLAAKGRLHDPAVLEAQARRMLKDPRSRALGENFAGQWLQLRGLANSSPDTRRFPDFDEGLRQAMKTETELFFDSIVTEDRSVLDFLDARYTFLNEQLARHYGIEGVQGGEFRRVPLTGDERGGILTQASLLTVTSNPTRTSPVKRGKWVMENLLGVPLPPAPPNVPALADDSRGPLVGTLRQRMEQHRKDPICASCHAGMDPIGFGLENYDAVGRWRVSDGDGSIDPSGVLPDGSKFNGPKELKQILLARKSQFIHCLTQKLMTYALGRGLERTDKCNIDSIVSGTMKDGNRFSAIVVGIVKSEPFREQRNDKGD